MSITVNATDANRLFAEILGKAIAGETVIITKRGEPVAQLVPYRPEVVRKAAWDRLLSSMERGVTIGISAKEAGAWKFHRDELYDRD